MNLVHDALNQIRFSSPFLFLLCAPLLMVWSLHFWKANAKKKIILSGLQEWRQEKIASSPFRWMRAGTLFALCLAIGITWAHPQALLRPPLNEAVSQERVQQFLFLLDLSGSMKDEEKIPGNPNGIEKFKAMRQAFDEFVQREKNARIGLVLFSDEAFVVAYPTHDHLFLEKEILQEDIAGPTWLSPPHVSGTQVDFPKNAHSQIARFSMGTSIANALDASLEVLREGTAPPGGRTVILVTDLIDRANEIVGAIARLLKEDVRVYVIGVEMDKNVAGAITQAFGTDSGVKLYSTQSPQEISYALYDISTRERALIFSYLVSAPYIPLDLFTICASIIFVGVVAYAIASETLFFSVGPVPSKRKKEVSFFTRFIPRRRKQ